MIIGVPREIKDGECRVALTPAGTDALVHAGHTVQIEESAGAASGFPDATYAGAGARLVKSAAEVYGGADLVLKVKEPVAEEYDSSSRASYCSPTCISPPTRVSPASSSLGA